MANLGDFKTRFEMAVNQANADQQINESMDSPLNEAKINVESMQGEVDNPGSVHGNMALINALTKAKKIDDYKTFAKNYPNGIPTTFILNYFASLNPKESVELAGYLYSKSAPKDLKADMYSNRNSVLGRLFDQKPTGLGKGEALIAWLIRGAVIQGGTESYDVKIGKDTFEVKDYSNGNSAIRAGVKSKVSNFEFWREIGDTLSRIDKLTGYSAGKPKFDISKYFSAEMTTAANYLMGRRGTIMSGECNLTDFKNLNKFYEEANKVENNLQGYTNVILRGPNSKPIELSIDLLDPSQVTGDTITFNIAKGDQTGTYVLAELKRLKYVRNPKDLQVDMQTAVNQIHAGLVYIVFRKNTINITTDFVPAAVSTSSLYFVERSIKEPTIDHTLDD
ncbi:MAG: hypothetical protein ACOVOV_00790 [Dolichospermum sp.]